MSFEYRIRMDVAPVALTRIADCLCREGLAVVREAKEEVVLAHIPVDQEKVNRWGGDVVISREEGGLFVRLLLSRDERYLQTIVGELESQGLKAQVEEV